jgi:ABC-type transport system involved in cytochrome c biogenesis permease subunit
MEGGFNDTMHMVLSLVFSLIVSVAAALSAVASRGWFRLYSIVTILVMIGFGGATSIAIRGIEENHTPWAGGFERINAYAYFAWLVVLAVTVMRRSLHHVTPEKGGTEVAQTREPSIAVSS